MAIRQTPTMRHRRVPTMFAMALRRQALPGRLSRRARRPPASSLARGRVRQPRLEIERGDPLQLLDGGVARTANQMAVRRQGLVFVRDAGPADAYPQWQPGQRRLRRLPMLLGKE